MVILTSPDHELSKAWEGRIWPPRSWTSQWKRTSTTSTSIDPPVDANAMVLPQLAERARNWVDPPGGCTGST